MAKLLVARIEKVAQFNRDHTKSQAAFGLTQRPVRRCAPPA